MKSAHDVFRGLRARARTGILVEGVACLGAAVAGFVVLSYVVDRSLRLETVFRSALLLGLVWLLARIALRRLRRPLAVELDDDELALAVERTAPGLRQALISAVEFERDLGASRTHGQSTTMMHSVVADAERRLSQIDFVRALDARRVVRFGALLAVAALGSGAFLGLVPDAGLWARRNLLLSDAPWPRATTLEFVDVATDRPLRIAEREDLTLRVRALGVVPDELELVARFQGGERAARGMDRTGDDLFATTLPSLLEDVELVARGGDGETAPLQVRIVARPRITDIALSLTPPRYIASEPRPLSEVGGEIRVPRGGTLDVTAGSSKPLRAAALVFGDDSRIPAELAADGASLRARIVPEHSGPVRIDATDRDDLGPLLPPQLLIRVIEDAPPELDFVTRGVGSLITSNARLPGALRVRDDFGLGAVTALFRTMEATPPEDGSKPAETEFAPARIDWGGQLEVGSTEQELELAFDLLPTMVDPDPDSERNPVHPGLLLSLRFDATDQKAPDAQTGSSEVRTFRVVTRDKLFQELRRRQEEQRRELERVLAKVKEGRAELAEIVSPTAADPNAPRARLRVQTLGRQQNAFGKTVQGVAERYSAVLDEYVNNRLLEPNVVRGFEARIVAPLRTLAVESFPDSATAAEAFADAGSDATRASVVESYDAIIAVIERVLDQMEKNESLSQVVEALRIVIRTEKEAQDLLEKLREQEGEGVFGGDPHRETTPPDDKKK